MITGFNYRILVKGLGDEFNFLKFNLYLIMITGF